MAHCKLPQQLDIVAERGVEFEHDASRNVSYLHVDGYTVARINRAPVTSINLNGDSMTVEDASDRLK